MATGYPEESRDSYYGASICICWTNQPNSVGYQYGNVSSYYAHINFSADNSSAALQNVLVPAVTLTGTTAAGNTVNTTLASNEATFVSGVFAEEVAPTKSQVSPPIQTLVVASSSPFVLPGQKILIEPIGLGITSVWTVLFVGSIAYGTIGRIRFRDSYRRRAAIASKGDMARI